MAFDETSLHDKYDLVNLVVSSGTQISSRTSTVVEKLVVASGNGSGENNSEKATIAALTATSKAGSKLVSIVEISKRELAARGFKVFQYNSLSSKIAEIPRQAAKKDPKGDEEANPDAAESSDDAFEVMGAKPESEMKKRSVPLMTTYLSTVQVKELKAAFKEQT